MKKLLIVAGILIIFVTIIFILTVRQSKIILSVDQRCITANGDCIVSLDSVNQRESYLVPELIKWLTSKRKFITQYNTWFSWIYPLDYKVKVQLPSTTQSHILITTVHSAAFSGLSDIELSLSDSSEKICLKSKELTEIANASINRSILDSSQTVQDARKAKNSAIKRINNITRANNIGGRAGTMTCRIFMDFYILENSFFTYRPIYREMFHKAVDMDTILKDWHLNNRSKEKILCVEKEAPISNLFVLYRILLSIQNASADNDIRLRMANLFRIDNTLPAAVNTSGSFDGDKNSKNNELANSVHKIYERERELNLLLPINDANEFSIILNAKPPVPELISYLNFIKNEDFVNINLIDSSLVIPVESKYFRVDFRIDVSPNRVVIYTLKSSGDYSAIIEKKTAEIPVTRKPFDNTEWEHWLKTMMPVPKSIAISASDSVDTSFLLQLLRVMDRTGHNIETLKFY